MTQRLIEIRAQAMEHVETCIASIIAANEVFTNSLQPLMEEMDGIEAPDSFKRAIIHDIFIKLKKAELS